MNKRNKAQRALYEKTAFTAGGTKIGKSYQNISTPQNNEQMQIEEEDAKDSAAIDDYSLPLD